MTRNEVLAILPGKWSADSDTREYLSSELKWPPDREDRHCFVLDASGTVVSGVPECYRNAYCKSDPWRAGLRFSVWQLHRKGELKMAWYSKEPKSWSWAVRLAKDKGEYSSQDEYYLGEDEKGIYLAVDVAPRLETETQFEMDGVKGNIYDMYASHVDCLAMMSYRDATDGIWRYGKEGYQAALRQNCKIILGAETGLYDCNDDCVSFYEEDMAIMYLKMSRIYKKLALVHPEKGYGIAFHCADTWMLMEPGDI